jgi:lysophospholipase L1-like esterase
MEKSKAMERNRQIRKDLSQGRGIAIDIVNKGFARLSRICRKKGISLIVIYPPQRALFEGKELREIPEFLLPELGKKYDFPTLDLSSIFLEKGQMKKNPASYYYYDELHFNKNGCRLVAETLFLYLSKNKSLP